MVRRASSWPEAFSLFAKALFSKDRALVCQDSWLQRKGFCNDLQSCLALQAVSIPHRLFLLALIFLAFSFKRQLAISLPFSQPGSVLLASASQSQLWLADSSFQFLSFLVLLFHHLCPNSSLLFAFSSSGYHTSRAKALAALCGIHTIVVFVKN